MTKDEVVDKMVELIDLNLECVEVGRQKIDHVQFKFFKDGFQRHLKVISATDSNDDDMAKTFYNEYTFTLEFRPPLCF